jgi:putative sigma-54 modulation protein
MELQITGTNIELSPVVNRYVERKLGKLSRHLPSIIETKVEISEEKTKSPQQHYLVRVTVNAGVGGAVFHGEERGEDLFRAIDKVAVIMTRQLENHKGKLYEKGRGNSLTRGGLNETTELARPVRKVVKTKRFTVMPMSVAEAIEQMELLRHNFFLFFDADAGEIKLLYRRNDGDYGLIEPEIG